MLVKPGSQYDARAYVRRLLSGNAQLEPGSVSYNSLDTIQSKRHHNYTWSVNFVVLVG